MTIPSVSLWDDPRVPSAFPTALLCTLRPSTDIFYGTGVFPEARSNRSPECRTVESGSVSHHGLSQRFCSTHSNSNNNNNNMDKKSAKGPSSFLNGKMKIRITEEIKLRPFLQTWTRIRMSNPNAASDTSPSSDP